MGKSCVARLLSVWCAGPGEQGALAAGGACDAIAALLARPPPADPSSLTLPTLDWLAAMCFENAHVSQMAVETW